MVLKLTIGGSGPKGRGGAREAVPQWGNRRQAIAPRASQPKQAAPPGGEAAPIEAADESRHFDHGKTLEKSRVFPFFCLL